AMASEEIAKAVCKRPPQESFAAGLLANIGKMVLDKFVVREIASIRDLAFDQGFSHDRAEAEVLGIDHAEAGAILLERWNLPEKIVEVVRFHHRPGLGSEENRQLIELVHMAEHATTLLSLGGGNDGTNYEFDQSCAARWGLTDSILETVLCRTMSRWEETQDFLPVLSGQEVNHEL
ncbi:MAG: HD-like signal output (HDOD) protein, partial [Planctomycetota bacterium]